MNRFENKVVIVTGGAQGIGAAQTIAENKASDTIKLVSFDADNKLVGFLKDGTISKFARCKMREK